MENRALILAASSTSGIEVGRFLLEARRFTRVSLLAIASQEVRLNARLKILENEGLESLAGDPTAIDFGLSGKEFLKLRAQTTHLVVCGSPHLRLEQLFIDHGGNSSVLEASRPLRLTVEALEFMKAPGPPMTVVLESSLMVFGDSDLDVTESDLDIGQSFPTIVHESLAVAEKIFRGGLDAHCVNILRAAPALGRLDNGEIFDGTGFAELARRISMNTGEFKIASRGSAVLLESLERIAWALARLTESASGGTFHLLDDDDYSDTDLFEWFARRFDVESPIAPRDRRVKLAAQWANKPGAELTFGSGRHHLKEAGSSLFAEKLGVRTEDYLTKWFPEISK